MKVLSYGEDPLTLDLLLNRTGEFLQKVEDPSSPDDCLLLYRPSFGRGAGGSFGEFDAILASPKAIYLIEAKWDHSSEVTTESVALRPTQVDRHRIMREYLAELLSAKNGEWDKSSLEAKLSSLSLSRNVHVPNMGTKVANNLTSIAKLLRNYGSEIIDVLLLFTEQPRDRVIEGDLHFKLIQMEYFPDEGNYYRLHLRPTE